MDAFVVITTSKDAEGTQSKELCEELEMIIPDSQYFPCNEEFPEHTMVVKVVENRSQPLYIRMTDSSGEVEFKIVSYKSKKHLKNRAHILADSPQLVANNFTSALGDQVVDWLVKLFPARIEGRQVASFHCHNDFIFFRLHRYIFTDDRVNFQDIGPHLTLRLRRLSGPEGTAYECKKYTKGAMLL